MKKLKVIGCNSCPLRFDSHCSSDSFCKGVSNKKHPFGRTLPEEYREKNWDNDSYSPDWCPLDSGNILIEKG